MHNSHRLYLNYTTIFYVSICITCQSNCALHMLPPPHQNISHSAISIHRFRFAGRVIGYAIIQNQLLDVFFARHFYKTLLDLLVCTQFAIGFLFEII